MKRYSYLLSIGLILSAAGCERVSSPTAVTSRPEAAAKFQKIAKEEFKYSVIIKDLDHTVWVYFPLEENILEYKATPEGPKVSSASQEKLAIRFLQVSYKDKTFNIDYDISPVKQYTSDPGYQAVFPENFQHIQQNILSTVGRAYLDLQVVPGDVEYKGAKKQQTHEELVNAYVKTDKAPEFFVIMFADIVHGMKMVNMTHFHDLEKALSINPVMAQEEYSKRYISEIAGDPAVIGDKTGGHVDYRDIEMPEFLAKQIQYRINLKYQQSSFAPGDDTVKEILKVVGETVQAYEFQDFSMVKLHDLANDKLIAFDPSQLEGFQEK